MRAFAIIVSTGFLISCGVVGSPVPPEFVGVAPTINKQKKQHALEADRQAEESADPNLTLEGHDIDLPPSQPVGIR